MSIVKNGHNSWGRKRGIEWEDKSPADNTKERIYAKQLQI